MAGKPRILTTATFDVTVASDTAAVTVLPFISVVAIEDDAVIKDIKSVLGERGSVAFTSVNAVRAVAQYCDGRALGWQVYCIGNATATAVKEYLNGVAIAATADNAADLADIIKSEGVKEVVFFCGDKRLGILPAKLADAGVKVTEVEVYRTVETPHSVDGEYDGMLFFSPSAVNSFFSMNSVPAHTVMFAIGNTTAAAIADKTSNKVIVCSTQSKEEVLRQAITYFQKQAEGIAQTWQTHNRLNGPTEK